MYLRFFKSPYMPVTAIPIMKIPIQKNKLLIEINIEILLAVEYFFKYKAPIETVHPDI